MKAYNYFLFRIYRFYTDTLNQKDLLNFYTSLVCTVIITLNGMSVYFLFEYFEKVPPLKNNYPIFIFGSLIWLVNYYFFVRKHRFLNYNFNKDETGGGIVVFTIILTFLISVSISFMNREKLDANPKTENISTKD